MKAHNFFHKKSLQNIFKSDRNLKIRWYKYVQNNKMSLSIIKLITQLTFVKTTCSLGVRDYVFVMYLNPEINV